MAQKRSQGPRSALGSIAFIGAFVALLGGLGAAAVFFGHRLYRQNQKEQAQAEQLRAAHRAADEGRQLLGRGDLLAAGRAYLEAYTLGLADPGVRFLLPWLASRVDLEVARLPHDKDVLAVAFSPDGRRALTGSSDKTARIWEVKTGQLLQRLAGHTAAVTGVWFSSDGDRVLTLSNDATCRLWRAAPAGADKQSAIATLSEPAKEPWLCRFSPDGLRILSVTNSTTARLWDGKTGQPIGSLTGHPSPVLLASFSPDSQRVLTAADKVAFLWEAGSGRLLATLRGHIDNVKDAVFSPDGSRIVTTSADQTARLWDGRTGQFLKVLAGHGGTVYSATFTLANGKAIMTISSDGTARLWDSQTGQSLFLPVSHPRFSEILALSKDGGRMVTLNDSGTLELWDRILGHMRASLSVGASGASGDAAAAPSGGASSIPVAFSPNGRRIVTGSPDGLARIWDGRSGQALIALKGHKGRIHALAWSADSSLILTGSADGTARIWRSHIDRFPRPLDGQEDEITSLSWSSDGKRLLSASRDGATRIWDAKSGERLLDIEGPRQPIERAFFTASAGSADESVVTLVRGGNGSAGRTPCVVRVIDSRSGRILATFGEELDLGRALDVSPAGDRVVTASSLSEGDNSAKLHLLSSPAPRLYAKLEGHGAPITAAAFSPDGNLLATSSEDHTVRVWDSQGGKLLRILEGHEQAVLSVIFAPDSRRLLTGAADRTARIFDAVTAASLSTLGGQVGSVRGVSFSPDGERALTIDGGDRAWLWSSPEGRLVAALAIYRSSNKGHIVATFSPDSTRVASAGEELRIYEGRSGLSLVNLDDGDDHAEVFTAAAFSPDGTVLATGAKTGAVKLWDVHLESRPADLVAAELSSFLTQKD
jgi:WD40 repeat protein